MSNLIYEEKPLTDNWLKALYAVPITVPLIAGMIRVPDSATEGLALFGVALFVGILYRLLPPQSFQVFDDKLRVKPGGTFHFQYSPFGYYRCEIT